MQSTQNTPQDYTAAQVETGVISALRAHDMESAVSLLHLLAVKDPKRAQMWLDAIELAS